MRKEWERRHSLQEEVPKNPCIVCELARERRRGGGGEGGRQDSVKVDEVKERCEPFEPHDPVLIQSEKVHTRVFLCYNH